MFNFLITTPLTNLVLLFYHTLGENLGFAIIFFTIFLRFLLLPLTIKQIKQQKKIAELQPRLKELQAKRKDSQQMSTEEALLMRQTAGTCLGTFLPILIQLPILIGLNSVIAKIASAATGDIFNNQLYFDFLKHTADYRFHTNFFGFDLAKIPSHIGINPNIIPYLVLIALLVITQYIQSIMMVSYQKTNTVTPKKPKANERKLTEKELEKEQMQEEMQKMMQMQTKYFIPVAIGIGAYTFTAALGLYWLVQNIFAIVQMKIQNGKDSKNTPEITKEDKQGRVVEFEDAPKTEYSELDNSVKEIIPNVKKQKKNKKKKNRSKK